MMSLRYLLESLIEFLNHASVHAGMKTSLLEEYELMIADREDVYDVRRQWLASDRDDLVEVALKPWAEPVSRDLAEARALLLPLARQPRTQGRAEERLAEVEFGSFEERDRRRPVVDNSDARGDYADFRTVVEGLLSRCGLHTSLKQKLDFLEGLSWVVDDNGSGLFDIRRAWLAGDEDDLIDLAVERWSGRVSEEPAVGRALLDPLVARPEFSLRAKDRIAELYV